MWIIDWNYVISTFIIIMKTFIYQGPDFWKIEWRTYDAKFVITKLWRNYDEFMIMNMLIFEISYDDFIIVSYDKVIITNNFILRLF